MKRFLLFLLLVSGLSVQAQIEKYVPSRPNPPRLVNDFTGTLTTEQLGMLEQKLVGYDDSTSNQIVIAMIPTTGDYPIEDVALRILRDWGVGNKDKNNGVVILVALDDHKMRIEVGYGLEGAVPDITAKSIIDNDMVPAFREGNFYRGLDRATDDIIKAAAGEYKAPKGYGSKLRKGIGVSAILFFIILFIILGLINRRGGGGGMISRRGYGDFWTGWILGNILSGGSSRGGWSGGGGGWSGGSGGGFGGFGGGSGGGGGASGSW